MTETSITNSSKARFAGLMCMIGGMMFSLYFIGLNTLLEILSPPLDPETFPALKMAISCATSACLAGGPLGILALCATGTGWKRAIGIIGAIITLLGLVSYSVGSVYIYTFRHQALNQFFTPAGSVLITLGMLLMASAVRQARRLQGWRALTPLLLSLYFPLQFPLQAVLFLGKGRGPNPILLGTWGFFWLLLGYAIRSSPTIDLSTAGFEPEWRLSGRRTNPHNEPLETGRSAHAPDAT